MEQPGLLLSTSKPRHAGPEFTYGSPFGCKADVGSRLRRRPESGLISKKTKRPPSRARQVCGGTNLLTALWPKACYLKTENTFPDRAEGTCRRKLRLRSNQVPAEECFTNNASQTV